MFALSERFFVVVPRVLFEGWNTNAYKSLLHSENEVKALTRTFVANCKKWKFNGYVLEVWPEVIARVGDSEKLIKFLKHLGTEFKKEKLDLILVIPSKRAEYNFLFTNYDYDELYDYVTAFSLMTYDYSNAERPGTFFQRKTTYEGRFGTPNHRFLYLISSNVKL